MKYDVLRQHIGDKRYAKGDVREAEPRDVAHLVKSGVLAVHADKKPAIPKAKKQPAPKNKAETETANKAEKG